jgi:N-acyl-D-aspartate/D-glutamate deacylase
VAFDLVIRGGTVVDGSGLGSYRADVGIVRDRIALVGRIRDRGRREINADGLVVTPGFVDAHTHMDAQIFWDHQGSNSCWHGVTTVVMGNCGFTLAPVQSDARALVVRNLERAEDMDPAVLAAGIEWSWETFPEYLDTIDRVSKGINYASNIGHSALRTWAMGERAFEETATDDDLARMATQLDDALRAGAIGFTSSQSPHHETSDDRPVASRLADWREIRTLAEVMSNFGAGIYEGVDLPLADASDPEEQERLRWERTRELTVELGVPFTEGLLATNPGGLDRLAMYDRIAAEGGRMIGQAHCRGINVLLSFRTRLPFDVLEEWQPVRALAVDEQQCALRDSAVRERLVEAAMHGDYTRWRGLGAMPRRPEWDGIRVYERGLPPNPTLSEVAQQRGTTPADVMIDLALATDFEQLFIQPSLYPQDPDVLLKVLRHPRTVMTFSDSGAHMSQICDSSIHTHLLGYWVRERGEFTLEEGVRMITLAPALAWGFADRGLLREGMVADINVFDPDEIAPSVPRIVEDLPAGGKRLLQRSVGFKATAVGGELTIVDGEPTGALPGTLIRNRVAAATPETR